MAHYKTEVTEVLCSWQIDNNNNNIRPQTENMGQSDCGCGVQ